ncbi:MAG: DnaJ C-terminal domain-containing protein [Woeseiaceae bacterium]|jgi:curved DNA-binding protein|nr:DnaJ C-terminal domain-containing protein [Woeseiaceae bacterium]
MEFRDYYEVMGVSRDATQDEIKKAYRRLARKYHPDVSKAADAEERFKEVGEAYAVLKDPEKRAAYDQLGKNWKSGEDFRPPPDWDAGFEFSEGSFGGDAGGFSDFFESLFGQGGFRAGGRPQGGFRVQGEDHHAKVLIDLEDAYRGASRSISLKAPELTPEGRVVTRERTLNVRIPKGVRQGQRIRLAGQGSPGIGGAPAGDLYLEIEFNPHTRYRVEGRDVFMRLPIAPWEAALGSSVTVKTPAGDVDMKVPAGTTRSRKLRLKGRGIPGKSPGDLYVELDITLPPADSEKAKKLYENMRDELAYDPRERMGA